MKSKCVSLSSLTGGVGFSVSRWSTFSPLATFHICVNSFFFLTCIDHEAHFFSLEGVLRISVYKFWQFNKSLCLLHMHLDQGECTP